MDEKIRSELLNSFCTVVIEESRQHGMNDALGTMTGKFEDRVNLSTAESMKDLSPQQTEAVHELLLGAIDSALMCLLEAIETNPDLDLTISKDGKTYSIRQLSDDLGADYWGFVSNHSKLLPKMVNPEDLTWIRH